MGQARLTAAGSRDDWPASLRRVAASAQQEVTSWQPIIIDMAATDAAAQLDALVTEHDIREVIDNYDEQYAELIVSRQPHLYQASLEVKRASLKDYIEAHYAGRPSWQLGAWVYYPWTGRLVHVLDKALFIEARTIRNKDLITADEQATYGDFAVGCAGMSVGSNVALSLALTGGSQRLKIADGAVISGSNLNRIVATVAEVGQSKSLVVARHLAEMNPYMVVERFADNLSEQTVEEFFTSPGPLQAVVDEIDDLKTKILLRVEAKRRRIPVIMATDLGDDVLLDVERFDLDPVLPLFHGLVTNPEDLLTREVSKREWLKYATSIVDAKNASLRMQQSLLKIGTKLVTQPQLGSTALMSGVVAAYAVRQIALGNQLKSGRTLISLDAQLRPDLTTLSHRREHRRHTRQLEQSLEAM